MTKKTDIIHIDEITPHIQTDPEHPFRKLNIGEDLLFVYGTLKNGGFNNSWLFNSEYKGGAITTNPYPMSCTGGESFKGIPYVIPAKGKGFQIKGDLFLPTDSFVWDAVDRLESHPDLYRRSIVEVLDINNNQVVKAWMYFASPMGLEVLSKGDKRHITDIY